MSAKAFNSVNRIMASQRTTDTSSYKTNIIFKKITSIKYKNVENITTDGVDMTNGHRDESFFLIPYFFIT